MSRTMIEQLTDEADELLEKAVRNQLSARRRTLAKREARRQPVRR
jgi:hypothetical protein